MTWYIVGAPLETGPQSPVGGLYLGCHFAGLRRASEDKKTVERQQGCGETSVTPRGIKEGGNSTAVCEVGCEQQPSLHLCGRARVCV